MCIVHKGFRGFQAVSPASILGGNLIGVKHAIPYDTIHPPLCSIETKTDLNNSLISGAGRFNLLVDDLLQKACFWRSSSCGRFRSNACLMTKRRQKNLSEVSRFWAQNQVNCQIINCLMGERIKSAENSLGPRGLNDNSYSGVINHNLN